MPNEQINIAIGSSPDTDIQANNPRLLNGFVQTNGEIRLLPALVNLSELEGIESIFRSTFENRLIIATHTNLYYYTNNALTHVANMPFFGYPIRMAENAANQICIVNGSMCWIFDQKNDTFTELNSSTHGFDLTNPRDVTAINTLFVVVGGTELKWIVSTPNNGFVWGGNEVITTDSSVGSLIGVAVLDNNLFIFGEGAIQRWVPSILRSPQDFPFAQDPSYQDEYGLKSTYSLVSKNNGIFYLSYNGQIRHISPQGRQTINAPGIQTLINEYTGLEQTKASYFYFQSHWFYQLTFEKEGKSWVYCVDSKTWCESTELILGNSVAQNEEHIVFLSDGLYELSSDFSDSYKNLSLQTQVIPISGVEVERRKVLGKVILDITQGKSEYSEFEKAFLSLSKDNISFTNSVGTHLSALGDRLSKLNWHMNYVAPAVTLLLTLHVKTDIVIKNCIVSIND